MYLVSNIIYTSARSGNMIDFSVHCQVNLKRVTRITCPIHVDCVHVDCVHVDCVHVDCVHETTRDINQNINCCKNVFSVSS